MGFPKTFECGFYAAIKEEGIFMNMNLSLELELSISNREWECLLLLFCTALAASVHIISQPRLTLPVPPQEPMTKRKQFHPKSREGFLPRYSTFNGAPSMFSQPHVLIECSP